MADKGESVAPFFTRAGKIMPPIQSASEDHRAPAPEKRNDEEK
jgi:hypothetical protein